MSRFAVGERYHGGWSNARSRSRQMAAALETTMSDKKPEKIDEPKYHPEYPHPAPPMSDQPWSDEKDDDEKKKSKVGKD